MDEAGDSGFEPTTYRSDDGLTLYARDYRGQGTTSGVPVVCLPGLTRNSRDFHQLALLLSRDPAVPRRVIALDYRGRGLSDRDLNKANYNVRVEAQDIISACRHFGIDRAVFIGTSRGGLILHFLAQITPELIAGIVLNDIGPKIEASGLKRIRDYLNTAAPPHDWRQAVAVLKACHSHYFTALRDRDWQEMAVAIYREIGGIPVADFDPAIAAQLQTIDFDTPLPDLWTQFAGMTPIPMLVVKGQHSDLLSRRTVEEMIERHPDITAVEAPGQGHAPLLHLQPALHAIRTFLVTTE
ncbi:alpha/beta hydrolase [Rhizobium cauense]|uniref:alpha/beta fold hydrolase n=1 Tax=Rhizobium cauense TaxID=1166683 RepID=UPI001C6F10B3|nr:alpha/beta hydrolase [Rhizobium cauense]